MKNKSALIYKSLLIGVAMLAAVGCASVPPSRKVDLSVQWIRNTTATENLGYRHSERTSPVIDGDVLFQGNGIDGFVALNRTNGKLIWRLPVSHGVESGAVVAGQFVYFGASDGQFYGVNKVTGKIAWSFPTRVENLSKALYHEGVIYFLAGNNVLYALDAITGKQLWLYNRGDVSSLSIRGGATPAIYKGTLYAGFSDGFLAALNSRDGNLIWERKINNNLKFVDVDASPLVDDEYIWVSSFDGALFCLSRNDGQIQWRLDDGGAVSATIEGNTLYYSSLSQKVYALDKKTGQQKWKYSFEEKHGVPTQPLLYKGMVIVGASDGDLLVLSQQSGQQLASYRPGAGVFATPALDQVTGQLYVLSNQAYVHKLQIAWHRTRDDLEWQ